MTDCKNTKSSKFGFNEKITERNKIELHIHLDCSIRITTLWELLNKKELCSQYKTIDDLEKYCRIITPNSLADFLKPCNLIISAIVDDSEALERVAYELCEDEAKEGVIYFELRFSPHLCTSKTLTAEHVVQSVIRGINRGQKDFSIKARIILCCIRGHPEWSEVVLHLCKKYQNEGVVGIDVAGDEAMELASPNDIQIYKQAKEFGIHRTIHAGEAGGASNVATAINEMCAERIGHGYHVLEDMSVYKNVIELGIHFEVCPYSSYLTGSVSKTEQHPVIRFAADNVSFSISKDDSTLIGKTLDDEYELLKKLGLKDSHFSQANINAAFASFLPKEEKEELVNQLKKIYTV